MQQTQSVTQEQIANTIQQFISEKFLYDRSDIELTHDFPLIEQGMLDSLQIMQLITFLQDNLGYVVEPEELLLENFESIKTITTLVSHSRE